MTESARLVITVDSTQAAKAGTDLSALERQATKTEVGINSLAKSAVAAFGALKLGGVISEAVMLASRYDQLGLVMNTVAGNTNRSAVEIAALDGELRKVGISAVQSRNNIIKMMGANIDLAQATKLAKLAQDAAVVGNTNSSEAFERLIKGIQSAEKETLETLGLNVNFQQSYEQLAKQLGKNADQLTTTEKNQAGVNAAMEAGKNIAGSYEASLTNAGKQLQSSTRYLEDLKVSLGAAAQPAFGLAVDGYVGSLKFLNENVGVVTQALETGLFIAIGRSVAAIGTSSVAFARDVVAKQAAATASLALAESEAIEAASNLRATTARHAAFASHVEITAATNANSAAQLRLAAAQKASSVATAAAVGAGSRILGLMGGPVGIALTVGAAALSFLDFGDKAKTGMGTAASATEQAATRIRNATRNMLPGNLETLPYGDIQAKLGDVGGQLDKAKKELDGFQKSFDAGSISKQWLTEPTEKVAALEGAYQKLKSEADGARFASDKAGSTYVESLGRQAALVGKVTEVEKLRANVQAGFIKLSATDLQAAELKAAAIDRGNESMRAGSQLEKESVKDAKAKAAALTDLLSQTDIATSSTIAMADAYLAGADNVRELTMQQKIEEELLKTGAGARDAVTAAVNREADAKDRLDITQSIADMRIETTQTLAQATATLQGKTALEAFNIQKSMTVALAGKNIEVGSKEYQLLLDQTKAQLDANKALEQAGQVEGIVDRLNPQIKLLKDYTAEQDALNAAIARYPENAALYQDALAKLGREYEVNQSKATIWGQLTEGAIDRIDGVFADAWANIGSGANNLLDSLVKGAKQAFGEIAHMLTTKPLLASISNWLTGTDNGQGLSSVWGKLLGSATGQQGGSGGMSGMGSNLVSMGKSIYQAYSAITGVGAEVVSGYASGGISGAIQGGASYYGNMLSSISSTLSNGFTSLVSTFTGATAVQTAAIIGAEGVTSAAFTGAVTEGAAAVGAQFTTGVATTTAATYAAAEAGAAATAASLGGQISAAVSSMAAMWPLAVVMGMYQSGKLYDSGVRPDAGEIMDSGGKTALGKVAMAPGAAMSGFFEAQDKVLSKVVGGKWAAILSGSTLHQAVTKYVGEKLFGGAWQTKNSGISLGVENGQLDAEQFIDQKKKGGLFSSSKKRTRYSALDAQTAESMAAVYDATEQGVIALVSRIGISANEGTFDGLNIAKRKLSTKGKTGDEVQKLVSDWFSSASDQMVGFLDGGTGGFGYSFAELAQRIASFETFNGTLDTLNIAVLGLSPHSMELANSLIAAAGGMEAFQTATNTYYDNFFSESEKADDALSAVTKQFAAMGVTLPGTRDAYRGMVEALDMTTTSGQSMFMTLTGLAGSAAQAYSILEQRADAAAAATAAAAEAAAEAVAAANAAAKELADALKEALMGSVSSAMSAVQRVISAQQKATTEAYNATTASLNDMVSTATENVSGLTSVGNDLSAALKALRGDSDDAVKLLRAQAQATLQSALAMARSGGSLSGLTGLGDALDTVSNNNSDLYGSLEDFARDQGRTANVVAELNGINGKQLTTAEKSLKGLEAQIELAKKAYDAQMAAFDSQLAFAQSQLDALNGVNTSVLSVAAAMQQMNAAVVAALSGKAAGAATQNTTDNNVALLESVYRAVLGRGLDGNGLATWTAALANGSVTYENLVQTIATGGRLNGETVKIPGYAAGGSFGGGLRLVGERGPELEVTGPSRIYNANQTASMLNGGGSNAGLVTEIRALGARLDMIQAETQAGALNGGKIVKLLDRVTDGGNAMQTTLGGETVKTKVVA
jgi:hypothetical protein